MKRHRILVTGATGYIGRHLVTRLACEGAEVYALARCRPLGTVTSLPAGALRVSVGNITNHKEVTDALKQNDIDLVIHLAGVVGGLVHKLSRQTYVRTNLDGTLSVCKACVDSGVRRLVHMSTAAVHGPGAVGQLIDEHYPYAPTTDYELSKAMADRVVLDYAKKGLDVIVLRPPLVYGCQPSPLFRWLFSYAGSRFVPVLGDGLTLKHFVHMTDLLECILLATERGNPGRAYLVADQTPVTINRLLTVVSSILNRETTLIHLPFPRNTFGSISKILPAYMTHPFSWFFNNRGYRIDAARTELGYHPRVSLRRGLTELLELMLRTRKAGETTTSH